MDIGPIRRRFTAEPLVSPVPAEGSPEHGPAPEERGVENAPAVAAPDLATPARA